MRQKSRFPSTLNWAINVARCGVAIIVSLFFLLMRFGIDKVKAVAPTGFYMTAPPVDPVHEPPVNITSEYISQPPVLLFAAILFLIFPLKLYTIIKKYRTTQFTGRGLAMTVLAQCYWWSIIYSIILIFIAIFSSIKFEPSAPSTIFLSLIFVSGIEIILVSAGDRRLQRAGIILILISMPVLLFWFVYFVRPEPFYDIPDIGNTIAILYYYASMMASLIMFAALPLALIFYGIRLVTGKLGLGSTQNKIAFLIFTLIFAFILFAIFELNVVLVFLLAYFIFFIYLIFKTDHLK